MQDPDDYRVGAQYPSRLNILEFAEKLCGAATRDEWGRFRAHEVMVKERLDPSYIEGMWIEDERTKSGLVGYLRSCGLVHRDDSGEETILNIPVDQFIHVLP